MPSIRELTIYKDIDRAFSTNTELAEAVKSIIEKHPSTGIVFQRVIDHFASDSNVEPSKKRIKSESLENGTGQSSIVTSIDLQEHKKVKTEPQSGQTSEIILTVREITFVTPLRKKLTLNVTSSGIKVISPGSDEKVELEVSFEDMSLISLLPVPEKAAKLYNFCIFRKSSDEVVVFTIPDSLPKTASGSATSKDNTLVATYKSLLTHVFNHYAKNVSVSEPSTKDFISAIPQPHRKHEPAVHVTAHRGSKEGYLFFLPEGLVYGFKRPLLYMPLSDISSITYNDILQRTFNLTVTSSSGEETEFSMIDIAEHDRVDSFVRKYQLNDASLSEVRRAKQSKSGNGPHESEIGKAADEIAASVTGHIKEDSDDEEDDNFEDDESHGGSTLGSSESGEESGDGDEDIGDVDTDVEEEEA